MSLIISDAKFDPKTELYVCINCGNFIATKEYIVELYNTLFDNSKLTVHDSARIRFECSECEWTNEIYMYRGEDTREWDI